MSRKLDVEAEVLQYFKDAPTNRLDLILKVGRAELASRPDSGVGVVTRASKRGRPKKEPVAGAQG